jgi:uncharacterized metal-binding protein
VQPQGPAASKSRLGTNAAVDIACFVALVAVAVTGAILRWVLPPGSGPERHDMRDLHVSCGIAFLALVAVHVALHWRWVVANVLRPLGLAAARDARGPAASPTRPAGEPLESLLARGLAAFTHSERPSCAECETPVCREGVDCTGRDGETAAWYANPRELRFVTTPAGQQPPAGAGPRADELLRLCTELGIGHVGVAFCACRAAEARQLAQRLGTHLQVSSVCCKVGCLPGPSPAATGRPVEPPCNPVAQARILGAAHTDLNVTLGACAGLDLVFLRHSMAPGVALTPDATPT